MLLAFSLQGQANQRDNRQEELTLRWTLPLIKQPIGVLGIGLEYGPLLEPGIIALCEVRS